RAHLPSERPEPPTLLTFHDTATTRQKRRCGHVKHKRDNHDPPDLTAPSEPRRPGPTRLWQAPLCRPQDDRRGVVRPKELQRLLDWRLPRDVGFPQVSAAIRTPFDLEDIQIGPSDGPALRLSTTDKRVVAFF